MFRISVAPNSEDDRMTAILIMQGTAKADAKQFCKNQEKVFTHSVGNEMTPGQNISVYIQNEIRARAMIYEIETRMPHSCKIEITN